MIIQWIGVALTVVGLMINGYKEFKNNAQNTTQVQADSENASQPAPTVQYSTVNIAYDHATGKHYFQHPNGQWLDFPPKP
jgi:hypothetical protein